MTKFHFEDLNPSDKKDVIKILEFIYSFYCKNRPKGLNGLLVCTNFGNCDYIEYKMFNSCDAFSNFKYSFKISKPHCLVTNLSIKYCYFNNQVDTPKFGNKDFYDILPSKIKEEEVLYTFIGATNGPLVAEAEENKELNYVLITKDNKSDLKIYLEEIYNFCKKNSGDGTICY